MSDRTDQTLTNLTYEVTQLAADQSRFCERLNSLNPNLVSDREVQQAKQRLVRLRALFTGLQRVKE